LCLETKCLGFSFLGSWCVCLCLWAEKGLQGLQGEVHDCKSHKVEKEFMESQKRLKPASSSGFFWCLFHVCYLHNNSTGASFLPCDFQRPDRHVTIIEMRRRSNDLVFICHVRGSKGVGWY
jgi:hypothetical protein